MYNLPIEFREMKLDINSFEKLSNFISNEIIKITKLSYSISFPNYYCKLFFSIHGHLTRVEYKSKTNKSKKFESYLPYDKFSDLLSEFDRLKINCEYKKEFIIYGENDLISLYIKYSKLLKIRGFVFTKIKNDISYLYLYDELILTINHKKQKIILENILITEDFSNELYFHIFQPIYNFNLGLNQIRNNLQNQTIDINSYTKFNELILNIQSFFNNININNYENEFHSNIN